MLNEEPAQSQDLQMMGMLLPLGIEKGKDFKPDVATVARLNSAAAEAHAWLLAQIPTFVADWWPGRRQAAGEFADRRVLPFHAVPTFDLSSYDNDCDLGRDRDVTYIGKLVLLKGAMNSIQPRTMSALADIRQYRWDVRKVPQADISTGGVAETAMSSDTETSKIDGRPNPPHRRVRDRSLARRLGNAAAGLPDVLEVWL
jgi:hypothetical protein